jgi:PIN domain
MGITMKSVADTLNELADKATQLAREFFVSQNYTVRQISEEYADGPKIFHNIFAKNDAGRKLQADLTDVLEEIKIVSRSTPFVTEIVPLLQSTASVYIDRSRWLGPDDGQFTRFVSHMKYVRELVAGLKDSRAGETLLMADTNALLHNPAIESWTFPDIKRFTIVVASTVYSELDSFENSNKNERVKEKASKLVRQFKDYRARGKKLTDGVPIVTDRISLLMLATEPQFDASQLRELNPHSNDDKIIARLIGLNREHPKCVTAIVTRDGNLQNKADHWRLNFLEPPAPK